MSQAQTDTDIKDTGVTVDPDDVINEILPFCAQGQVGRDLLSQADYTEDMQRNIGHQPGIARAALANKQARQAAHMAAGLAQFLARRYTPGVVDDGDLDKVEAALVAAVRALRSKNDASFALCESAADEAVKVVELDDFELVPGSKVFLRFSAVNTAVNPQVSINGSDAKPLRYLGMPVEVGNLAKGAVYELIYTGADWQILGGMAPWGIGQYDWVQDTLLRPGLVPCNGCAIADASQYPQILAYLATPHGQTRCFASLAERDAAHVAAWGAGTYKANWAGVGGLAKFFYDAVNDILYMPDLVGMFEAMGGDGIIAPSTGGVKGDVARRITGTINPKSDADPLTGVFYNSAAASMHTLGGGISGGVVIALDSWRGAPGGAANIPRSFGAVLCAYLGQHDA